MHLCATEINISKKLLTLQIFGKRNRKKSNGYNQTVIKRLKNQKN